jgi:holo-[acyl-carrier protein] synthase
VALRVFVGLDSVDIGDFGRRMLEPAFRERAFSPAEMVDDRAEHLAGLFAAKEAYFKALGRTRCLRDIAVRRTESGRPRIYPQPAPTGLLSLDVSITHDGGRATAIVVALVEDDTAGDDEECH